MRFKSKQKMQSLLELLINKNKILSGESMEFASRQEMLAYEKAREDYYAEFISAVERRQIGKFYKLWIREILVPKYRKLKKEYDEYHGGWWRDEYGIIHAKSVWCVDTDKITDGTICITES